MSHQEDIASKLLHSSDARIAEAAKRVFSSFTAHLPLPAAAASLAALSAVPTSAPAGFLDESAILTPTTSGADHSDQYHGMGGLPLHGGSEHTANINESAASNDEDPDDKEGSDKKPSSTERLKRR